MCSARICNRILTFIFPVRYFADLQYLPHGCYNGTYLWVVTYHINNVHLDFVIEWVEYRQNEHMKIKVEGVETNAP